MLSFGELVAAEVVASGFSGTGKTLSVASTGCRTDCGVWEEGDSVAGESERGGHHSTIPLLPETSTTVPYPVSPQPADVWTDPFRMDHEPLMRAPSGVVGMGEGEVESETHKMMRLEVEHYIRVLNAMRNYGNWQLQKVERKRSDWNALNERFKSFLATRNAYVFDEMTTCINTNQFLLTQIVDASSVEEQFSDRMPMFLNSDALTYDINDSLAQLNLGKARSTLKQLMRDWSAEGAAEREECYGPILRALDELYASVPKADRHSIRILNPGCGLARLPWEIARLGFRVEANEFDYFMLCTTRFVLNHCVRPELFFIFPFCDTLSNVVDHKTGPFRPVAIPDVSPHTLVTDGFPHSGTLLSMVAGEFGQVYGPRKMDQVPFQTVAIAEDTLGSGAAAVGKTAAGGSALIDELSDSTECSMQLSAAAVTASSITDVTDAPPLPGSWIMSPPRTVGRKSGSSSEPALGPEDLDQRLSCLGSLTSLGGGGGVGVGGVEVADDCRSQSGLLLADAVSLPLPPSAKRRKLRGGSPLISSSASTGLRLATAFGAEVSSTSEVASTTEALTETTTPFAMQIDGDEDEDVAEASNVALAASLQKVQFEIDSGAAVGSHGRVEEMKSSSSRRSLSDGTESAAAGDLRFDCVVMCFFLDTAHNVLEYVDVVVNHLLADGGYLVNVGPLLYHFDDYSTTTAAMHCAPPSIELSWAELRYCLTAHFGMRIVKEQMGVPTSYVADRRSMAQTAAYRSVFFVAQKQSAKDSGNGGAEDSPMRHAMSDLDIVSGV